MLFLLILVLWKSNHLLSILVSAMFNSFDVIWLVCLGIGPSLLQSSKTHSTPSARPPARPSSLSCTLTLCLVMWLASAYWSLLRQLEMGLQSGFAPLFMATGTATWSYRSQNDEWQVKQTWTQPKIKPSLGQPTNTQVSKKCMFIFVCH